MLTLTTLLLASAVMAQTPRDRRTELLKQAKAAEKSGDLAGKARAYERIAEIEELKGKVRTDALMRAAQLYRQLGKHSDRQAAIEKVTALKEPDPGDLVEATETLAAADARSEKTDRAVARYDAALARKNVKGSDRARLLNGKAALLETAKGDANSIETLYRRSADLGSTHGLRQLIRLRKTAGADANELRDLYVQGARDRKLTAEGLTELGSAQTEAQRQDLAIAWLSRQTLPTPRRDLLRKIVPADSSTRLWFDTAQSVTNAYRRRLIARDGRLELPKLKAFADQLVQGGQLRVLGVSDAERSLATKLEQAEAFELQGWFVAMLRGQYATAARIAADKAREANSDADFKRWVLGIAAAVRCLDQCYNGRAMDYVRWVNGDQAVKANPIADVLAEKE
jgi:hypothetical protein